MDEYDRIMGVDLKGVLLGTKHGIKAMLPTGGAIVNWASIGGMNGSLMPTSVYSSGQGRRDLVHQGRGHRVRRAGRARQRRVPRVHRDRR